MKPPAERDVIAFVADDSNGQLRAPNEGRKEETEGGREEGGKKKKPFRSVATAMMAAARNVFMYRFHGGGLNISWDPLASKALLPFFQVIRSIFSIKKRFVETIIIHPNFSYP